jgi:hypothetical protein
MKNLIFIVFVIGGLFITSCQNCSRSGRFAKERKLNKQKTEVQLVYEIASLKQRKLIIKQDEDSFLEIKIPYSVLEQLKTSGCENTRNLIKMVTDQSKTPCVDNVIGTALGNGRYIPKENEYAEIFLSIRVNPRCWGKNESSIDYMFSTKVSEPLCGYNNPPQRKEAILFLLNDLKTLF